VDQPLIEEGDNQPDFFSAKSGAQAANHLLCKVDLKRVVSILLLQDLLNVMLDEILTNIDIAGHQMSTKRYGLAQL